MVNIQKYSLRVVKESSGRYKLDKVIKSSESAAAVFKDVLQLDQRAEEVFAMVTLDIKNQVTGVFEVSQGTLSASQVHPREVFKRALLQNAAGVVLAHNHPSGVTYPSNDDIKITQRLVKAGKILGIEVLDHIIVGDFHYSLRSENHEEVWL